MSTVKSRRPLSPHLQVYKPQMTSGLSILHRITGFGCSVGLLLLSCWLYHAAYAVQELPDFLAFLSSGVGMLLLFFWSVAFYYHLANGIRHLFWDAGKMLEIQCATKAGYFVLGVTIGLTVATWGYVLAEMPL